MRWASCGRLLALLADQQYHFGARGACERRIQGRHRQGFPERQLAIGGIVNGQPMTAGQSQNAGFARRSIDSDDGAGNVPQEACGSKFGETSATLA